MLISSKSGKKIQKSINSFLCIVSGVYIFLFDPPPSHGAKIWQKNRLGGKNEWKKIKKGGGNAYFFPKWVESMHIFRPIDLKYTKLQKIGFVCGAHTFFIINFSWGKNIKQGGGGAKILISNLIYTPVLYIWRILKKLAYCIRELRKWLSRKLYEAGLGSQQIF